MQIRRSSGRRLSVATVLAGVITALLPSVHAQAAVTHHFSLRLNDNFTRGISSNWWRYDGQPGGNPYGYWKQSHAVGVPGAALLRGYHESGRYVTGGMMLNAATQTYGQYLVKARYSNRTDVQHVLLLWPTKGWPPEVDFSEGPTSQGVMATAHWGSNNSQVHAWKRIDMTQWHVYGVQWTPDKLVYLIDGKPWATMTGSAVPHVPMRLCIQTAATQAVPSTLGEVRMTIDAVSVYSWS